MKSLGSQSLPVSSIWSCSHCDPVLLIWSPLLAACGCLHRNGGSEPPATWYGALIQLILFDFWTPKSDKQWKSLRVVWKVFPRKVPQVIRLFTQTTLRLFHCLSHSYADIQMQPTKLTSPVKLDCNEIFSKYGITGWHFQGIYTLHY